MVSVNDMKVLNDDSSYIYGLVMSQPLPRAETKFDNTVSLTFIPPVAYIPYTGCLLEASPKKNTHGNNKLSLSFQFCPHKKAIN